ncbi:MAG: hypothetical protein F2817_18685, partial [Actinobacteria bacterium]|nr:hypothetical protein [Actinomycetota bacterium]
MNQSHVRRVRAGAIASAAVTAGLLAPSAAHAVVTTTNVTSPAAESILDSTGFRYGTQFGDERMTVKGVAPGAADGDPLAMVCTYTLNGVQGVLRLDFDLDDPVVVSGGAFEAPDVHTPALPCRVRAIPYDMYDDDTVPEGTDFSAFTGPRLLGGTYSVETVDDPGGPADGAQMFGTTRGQRKGLGFIFGSGGLGGFSPYGAGGGILTTALLDDTYYRPLFGPTGFLASYGLFGGGPGGSPGGTGGVGLVVDGEPATPTSAVDDLRSKVVSRTFDPATGDQTIVEETPIARVLFDGDGDVAGYEAAGLMLRRTVSQDRDGRRFGVGDQYVSTDGAAHRVEARYLQALYSVIYGNSGNVETQEPASYRFPWTTGEAYVQPGAGDEIAQPPAGPTTILVHGPRESFSFGGTTTKAARADALLPRAEGAYVFDSAPSNLKFLSTGAFVANFVRDVPAGGSAGVGQTFLQDLTPEGLGELLTPPASPAPPAAAPLPSTAPLPTQVPALPPTPFDPLPTLARSTGRVLLTPAQGRRLRDRKPVTVTTKGMPAGRYGVTIRRRVPEGRTIASGIRTIKQDGVLKVTLKLT